MGRLKGSKLSEETKQSIALAKAQRKENVIAQRIYTKQKLYITGEERNGFDFWPLLRNCLRPLHQYALCDTLEKDIVKLVHWNNVPMIKEKLSEYFILRKKA